MNPKGATSCPDSISFSTRSRFGGRECVGFCHENSQVTAKKSIFSLNEAAYTSLAFARFATYNGDLSHQFSSFIGRGGVAFGKVNP
jgi:hypothetical protein